MDPPERNVNRKSRRKRRRFSVKVFLCLFTLLLLLTAVGGKRVYQQHRALSWASRNGAEVRISLPTDLQEKPTWLVAILVAFVDPAPTVVFRNAAAVDLGPLGGSRLSSVELYGCAVYGLSAFQHVHALEEAYLKEVTVKDWSGLVLPSTLTGFGAVDGDLSDITFLNGLVKLDSLILERTAVQDLSPLKGLAHLRRINLDGSPVSDLGPLAEVSNLQYLNLARTSVSDLAPLRGLKYLQSLYLTETRIRDISALGDLVLVHLDLSFTDVNDISALAEQQYLLSVDLSFTEVNDIVALAEQKYLGSLSLCGTRIDNLDALKELKSLTRLNLGNLGVLSLSPLETLRDAGADRDPEPCLPPASDAAGALGERGIASRFLGQAAGRPPDRGRSLPRQSVLELRRRSFRPRPVPLPGRTVPRLVLLRTPRQRSRRRWVDCLRGRSLDLTPRRGPNE